MTLIMQVHVEVIKISKGEEYAPLIDGSSVLVKRPSSTHAGMKIKGLTRNATVLPVPVLALARTSLPRKHN